MCTNNNPLYINNIFNETHPELRDLYENLQELQNNFAGASYEDIETENIIETEVEDFHDDFDDEINNEVFQICCNKNCLEEIDQEVAILQNSTSTSEYLTMAYAFDGVAICSNAFLKLYNLSKNRLNGLKNHYKDNDIVPKVHLSKGKK
ncbi:12043_t:CDS:2, partial [Entrophospora sp. SA101]